MTRIVSFPRLVVAFVAFSSAAHVVGCSDADDPTTEGPRAEDDGGTTPTPSSDGGTPSTGGDGGGGPTAPTRADVQALVDQHCMPCHDGQGGPTLVLLDIGSAVGRRAETTSGTLIVPGNPDESLLIHAIEGNTSAGAEPMPLGSDGLAPADSAVFRAWIAAGAN